MKPAIGILAEVAALAMVLASGALVPAGLLFGLYVVAAELLATYLVHCPAHYVIGTVVGIRFRQIRFGRTTLARALPEGLSPLAKLFPVLTLVTAKDSFAGMSRKRLALMYEAGAFASTSIALFVAAAATFVEAPPYAALAWVVGLGYLAFDLAFSPKSGDLARARAALA